MNLKQKQTKAQTDARKLTRTIARLHTRVTRNNAHRVGRKLNARARKLATAEAALAALTA